MKKSELREMITPIIKEILTEDSFRDLTKSLDNLVQNFTPASVVRSIGSALQDSYLDKKITKSYVKKAIAAFDVVQKMLQKTISK